MSYPNSDLSAWQLILIAVVMLSVLAAWLMLVYAAARKPRRPDAPAPSVPVNPADAPVNSTDASGQPGPAALGSRQVTAA